MEVPPGRPGSWEDVLHQSGGDQLLQFDQEDFPHTFKKVRGHRAIGVVSQPEYESRGNYVPTILPRRYDAFLFIDQTKALRPLHIQPDGSKPPETYPWGV
jgi:erythromycin esterase-like protein